MSCIGHAVRHTASISSVAISQTSLKFFTTVAQDSCLKLWDLPNNIESRKSEYEYHFLNENLIYGMSNVESHFIQPYSNLFLINIFIICDSDICDIGYNIKTHVINYITQAI